MQIAQRLSSRVGFARRLPRGAYVATLIFTRKRASGHQHYQTTMQRRDGVTGLSRGEPPRMCVCVRTRYLNRQERDPDGPAGQAAGRARTSQAARVTDGHIAFRGSISPRFRGCNSRKVVSGPCFAGAVRRKRIYTASLHPRLPFPPSPPPLPPAGPPRSHPPPSSFSSIRLFSFPLISVRCSRRFYCWRAYH